MTVVVAEVGLEHGGDALVAADLVRRALAQGADYVKGQLYVPDLLCSRLADPDQHARLVRWQTTPEIAGAMVAAAPGRVFFSVMDAPSLGLAMSLGVAMVKIGSGDVSDLRLVRAVAEAAHGGGLPLILSAGMHDDPEVERALGVINDVIPHNIFAHAVTVLHCVSAYPAAGALDLGRMNRLGLWFGQVVASPAVGFSDHTRTPLAAQMAVALGATMIEAHVTTGRGPDAGMAWKLDPWGEAGFENYVRAIREAAEMMEPLVRILGTLRNSVADVRTEAPLASGWLRNGAEEVTARSARKSLAAARPVRRGEPWDEGNLTVLRPGTGLSAGLYDEMLGTPAARDYEQGELL